MAIPIIFLHAGNSFYLPYTILQCKRWNPRSDIILLGDSATRILNRCVVHVPYLKYLNGATRFFHLYRHHSTNSPEFELPCFLRWFILYEFLAQHRIAHAVYLDSDVLVYSDLSSLRPATVPRGQMTVVGVSPHTNFIHGLETLADFLDFCLAHYQTPSAEFRLSALVREHQVLVGNSGGISDMTFFRRYRLKYPGRIDDLSTIADDKTCFDITYDTPQGFLTVGGVKAVRWVQDQPYCRRVESEEWIRFHTLHFQGTSKRYIPRAFRPRALSDLPFFTMYTGVHLVQRVRNKLVDSSPPLLRFCRSAALLHS